MLFNSISRSNRSAITSEVCCADLLAAPEHPFSSFDSSFRALYLPPESSRL